MKSYRNFMTYTIYVKKHLLHRSKMKEVFLKLNAICVFDASVKQDSTNQ